MSRGPADFGPWAVCGAEMDVSAPDHRDEPGCDSQGPAPVVPPGYWSSLVLALTAALIFAEAPYSADDAPPAL